MALAYIGFQFLRIDIPVGTERTALHLGNAFVVLGSLLLGGLWGGISGALGLTIADLTSGYVTTAPMTFVLKLIMGLIVGLVSRKLFHITRETSVAKQSRIALVSSAVALGANVILDPFLGYFYKTYIIGIPQDVSAALAKLGSLTTFVNAGVSVLIITFLWPVLYKALKKSNLITWGNENNKTENK